MAARQSRRALLLLAAAAALLAAAPTPAAAETPTGLVAAWYAESDGLPMAQLSTPTGYVATYFLDGQVAIDTGFYESITCTPERGPGTYQAWLDITTRLANGTEWSSRVCEIGTVDLQAGLWTWDDGVDRCPTDLLLNKLYLANSTLVEIVNDPVCS